MDGQTWTAQSSLGGGEGSTWAQVWGPGPAQTTSQGHLDLTQDKSPPTPWNLSSALAPRCMAHCL